MKKLPVFLQLYTVQHDLETDFFGTLEKVKEMGYEGVELGGHTGGYKASEIKAKLDELGLKAVSAHVGFADMLENKEKNINFYKGIGCEYIIIPWLSETCLPGGEYADEYHDKIIEVSKALKEAGMELLYHNHNFEFKKIGEDYILDLLYDSIPKEYLQAELDTCWVSVAGEDPVKYVKKYGSRMPVVHFKDFAFKEIKADDKLFDLMGEQSKEKKESKTDFDFRPVGYGVMDFPKILEAVLDSNIKYIVVEQDRSTERPAMEAARMSRNYLRSLGV